MAARGWPRALPVRKLGLKLTQMKALSALLIVLWCLLAGLTVYAVSTLGSAGGAVFFSDFQHPWRAQFNTDFTLHLLLFIVWVAWREDSRRMGVFWGLLCLMAGLVTPLYLLLAVYRAHGDPRKLLLGAHASWI